MRRKSVKPSEYPRLPFHGIRLIAFISSLVVAIILSVFAYNLHTADHRLPWAFLVLLISAFLALLNLTLTTMLHCCYGLSPRLSLITNSIVLLLYLVSLVLLSWSLSHTILTTCNATYWATSTGIAVCRIYKVLFTFTIVASAAHIAAIILDIIVYRRHTRLGEYDPMAGGHSLAEYKSDAQHERDNSVLSGSFPHPNVNDEDRSPLVTYHQSHQRRRSEEDIGDSRPSQPPLYNSGAAYSDAVPVGSQQGDSRLRMSGYDSAGNPHHTEQTSYDPFAYR